MKKLLSIALMTLLTFSCEAKTNKTLTLSKNNTLVLNEEVNELTTSVLLAKAMVMDANLNTGEPIYLFLNTPGGSIKAGLSFIDTLSGLGRPVHTVTIFAASMGFQIAQGLSTRYVLANGEYMSHRAAGQFGGSFGGKEASQLSTRYNSWLEKIKQLDMKTVSRTNGKQTLESYQAAYQNEMWVTGAAAVAAGYSDEVVSPKCDESLSTTHNQQFEFFGMVINLVMSDCPMITGPIDVQVNIRTRLGGMMNLKEFTTKGGEFGNACVNTTDITKLCAQDVTLTIDKIDTIKSEILNKFNKDKTILKY